MLFVLYGPYQGIVRAVGKAFASDFVPEHLRASGVGWYNTAVGLAEVLSRVSSLGCCGMILVTGPCFSMEQRLREWAVSRWQF